VLQVHELSYDEESLKNREYNKNAVAQRTRMHQEYEYELDGGNANQYAKSFPNPAGIRLSNFAGGQRVFSICVRSHNMSMMNKVNELFI
jgi:hypothetical protein